MRADRGIQLAKLGADRGGPRLILGRIDQLGDVPIVAQGDQLILERASLVGVRIRHLLRCDSAMAVQPPLILPPRAIKVGRRQRNELAVLPLVRRRTARAHVGQDSLHEGIQLQPLPGGEKIRPELLHLRQLLVALGCFERCGRVAEFPGAHQMGRAALDRLHGESSEPVRRDRLPESRVLTELLAASGFSAIKIVDEAERYVAWGRA